MTTDITGADSEHLLDEGWSTPLEAGVRGTIRGFIETLLEEELEAALGRARYARLKTAAEEHAATAAGLGKGEHAAGAVPCTGHRHGRRERQVMGSFGAITVAVPRARLGTADGRTTEWVNKTLPAYRRRTREVDALIAGSYLAGTNTRRVGRALTAVFRGAISKSTVSRVWRQIKTDWDSWNRRDLKPEDIVRLILDGTVVKVRLDKKATSISLLVALGVRRDGQKVLLAVKNMGGESEAAWRGLLDDLTKRGLKRPELAIVDGAPGLEKALASLWPDLPLQRCTVHKLRNLIAHAPKRLADEIKADYADMIYADDPQTVEKRRKAFIRKWRDKCGPSRPAWRRPATSSSPSHGCPSSNGNRRAPPTPSSACTWSSSGASRRRPCCPRPRRLRCCSGRCLPQARSCSGRSTSVPRSHSPLPSRLTSPPDPLP
jgi:transposase-like protein